MKVFVASNMPTDYPSKLQKPSTVSDRVRTTAETFILDSGIGEDVTTNELVALSHEYDPDFLVAKDELNNHATTITNTLELLDREYSGELLIPLQPDYVKHFEKLKDHIDVHDHKYVLGGMAISEVSTAQQLEWITKFREVAPDVYAHGLGVGGGIEFVEAVAGTGLLDSIDCATPEMPAINGCVLDQRLRQQETMVFPGGEGRMNRTYPLAEYNSYQLRDVWERENSNQHDLTGW